MAESKAVNTSGKHKTAVARATVTRGKGVVRINSKPLSLIDPELARLKMTEPIVVAGPKFKGMDISVTVSGGGIIGQAMASRVAIARGIVAFLDDKELEKDFKDYDRGFVVNDPRQHLPKKPLGRGARKKRQKSYR